MVGLPAHIERSPAQQSLRPARRADPVTLRPLSNSMSESFGADGDIFESAIMPDNNGFGVLANVYAEADTRAGDRKRI